MNNYYYYYCWIISFIFKLIHIKEKKVIKIFLGYQKKKKYKIDNLFFIFFFSLIIINIQIS